MTMPSTAGAAGKVRRSPKPSPAERRPEPAVSRRKPVDHRDALRSPITSASTATESVTKEPAAASSRSRMAEARPDTGGNGCTAGPAPPASPTTRAPSSGRAEYSAMPKADSLGTTTR